MRVLISGGFDPIHVGHIRYIKEAERLGTQLIIVVNNDGWLKRKKGRAFMSSADRVEILKAIAPEAWVHVTAGEYDDVSREILLYEPHIFAKGGDRDLESLPQAEKDACASLDCQIITGVGGDKIRSSSELLKNYAT